MMDSFIAAAQAARALQKAIQDVAFTMSEFGNVFSKAFETKVYYEETDWEVKMRMKDEVISYYFLNKLLTMGVNHERE